jgi:hypothetical protein
MHEISKESEMTKQALFMVKEIAGMTEPLNDEKGSFAPQHPIDPVELMVQK